MKIGVQSQPHLATVTFPCEWVPMPIGSDGRIQWDCRVCGGGKNSEYPPSTCVRAGIALTHEKRIDRKQATQEFNRYRVGRNPLKASKHRSRLRMAIAKKQLSNVMARNKLRIERENEGKRECR